MCSRAKRARDENVVNIEIARLTTRIVRADHLGTNCSEMKTPLRQHKRINTMEGRAIYSKSLADANRLERLRHCKTVYDSVMNVLDQTPWEEWTQQHLDARTDNLHRATDLARQLNVKRQNLIFVSSGTLFEPEQMPPDQQIILEEMLDASPACYGHVMMQINSNPSLPIHTPDLPPKAQLLDPHTRMLVVLGNYPSLNECLPGHTKTGGDCNQGFTSVLRKHNMSWTPNVKFLWTHTLLVTCTPTCTPMGTRGGM